MLLLTQAKFARLNGKKAKRLWLRPWTWSARFKSAKPGGAALAQAYNTVGRVNEVPPGNQWAHSRPFHSSTIMQVAFRLPV
ncbi:hypothetical protein TUM20903_30760 [Citrobacter koseri]|nr:hypothetical protein TUM13189_30980 [Citrobacter koseri]BDG90338.1 hypothetical protein TUM20903_30760 [Citrobacter koseri]